MSTVPFSVGCPNPTRGPTGALRRHCWSAGFLAQEDSCACDLCATGDIQVHCCGLGRRTTTLRTCPAFEPSSATSPSGGSAAARPSFALPTPGHPPRSFHAHACYATLGDEARTTTLKCNKQSVAFLGKQRSSMRLQQAVLGVRGPPRASCCARLRLDFRRGCVGPGLRPRLAAGAPVARLSARRPDLGAGGRGIVRSSLLDVRCIV